MNLDQLQGLSDLDLWSGLVGFLMPALIAALVQSHWSSQVKGAATVGVCIVGGGVTAWLTGYLHGITVIRAILVVLGAALVFYQIFWKPSKIAPSIEKATDLAPPR
jgi:ABC-type xylose transport system permease subunit